VEVPPQLSQQHMAVMALWLRWDPFADRMAEFDVSKSPELDARNLYQYSMDMWEERNQLLRAENDNKEWWTAKIEEKLKTYEAVNRSQYPEDLKAYVDGLEENVVATNKIGEYIDEEKQEAEEEQQNENEIDDRHHKQENAKSLKSIHVELKKNLSTEIERRQLEQMEKISNSLKYIEKPNELNPRRYVRALKYYTKRTKISQYVYNI